MGPKVGTIVITQKEEKPIGKIKRKLFERAKDDPNVFLSTDSEEILLAPDIPYNEGKTVKTIRKFCMGTRIKPN